MILHEEHVTVRERHITVVILLPLRKLVVRKSFRSFEWHVVDGCERLSVHYLAESLILHGLVGKVGELECGRMVAFVGKAVGVCVVGQAHMQPTCCLIHDLNEVRNAALRGF